MAAEKFVGDAKERLGGGWEGVLHEFRDFKEHLMRLDASQAEVCICVIYVSVYLRICVSVIYMYLLDVVVVCL